MNINMNNIRKRHLDQHNDDVEPNKKHKYDLDDIVKILVLGKELSRRSDVDDIDIDTEEDDDEEEEEEEYEEEYEPEEVEQDGKIEKVITFDKKITSIDELIKLGESYSNKYKYICNLNMKKLNDIVPDLKQLNNLIGLAGFKRTILKQIIFLLMGIQNGEEHLKHIVLYGNPGAGKTTIAQIIGCIYSKIGLLSKGTFKTAQRTDFMSNHIGESELKTMNLLKSCIGGVLFIDEAYALGSKDSKGNSDSFEMAVINTLNLFLSEHYKDFICIIAGYKDNIQENFFSRNRGLQSRFSLRYTIDDYNPKELSQIFQRFVQSSSWYISDYIPVDSYFTNKCLFPSLGRDIRTFLEKCKEVHSERALLLPREQWKLLSKEDIDEGFRSYKTDRDVANEGVSFSRIYI